LSAQPDEPCFGGKRSVQQWEAERESSALEANWVTALEEPLACFHIVKSKHDSSLLSQILTVGPTNGQEIGETDTLYSTCLTKFRVRVPEAMLCDRTWRGLISSVAISAGECSLKDEEPKDLVPCGSWPNADQSKG
jgi:hypothetical protein